MAGGGTAAYAAPPGKRRPVCERLLSWVVPTIAVVAIEAAVEAVDMKSLRDGEADPKDSNGRGESDSDSESEAEEWAESESDSDSCRDGDEMRP
mmetsp:Transcript_11273/g.13333  ORF Transcript_11273/g.13333 Transcript_11273/m.13333 type:complete len:94 (+) Transcript_11273:589-870(+)